MDVHQNARTTPHSREKIVGRAQRGETAREIATALEICESTVRKWLRRYHIDAATPRGTVPSFGSRCHEQAFCGIDVAHVHCPTELISASSTWNAPAMTAPLRFMFGVGVTLNVRPR
jgi:hypothetical protein